jgi:hypothetical protein
MEDEGKPKPREESADKHAKLLDMAITRLSDALGRPKRAGAVVAHWSIERPHPLASVSVMIPAIIDQPPRVWLFDPNDPSHNIHSEVIATPEDIDRVTEIVTSKVHKRPPRRP